MVALVATSCKKKEEAVKFELSFAETTGFEAGPSIDDEKAYLDPNDSYKFKWNEGDAVMVYNLSKTNPAASVCGLYQSAPGSEGQAVASFSGVPLGAKKDAGFFVFYNPEKAHGDLQNNRETFTVAGTQTYDPAYLMDPTTLVMASEAEVVDEIVVRSTMKHIFGFLNVAIADNLGSKKVSKIVVRDAMWNLTGDLDLNLTEVDTDEFTTLLNQLETSGDTEAYQNALSIYLTRLGYHAHGERTKEITLECNNFALPYRTWQYFFIPVRPGALYKGFTVEIYLEGATEPTYTKTFDENVDGSDVCMNYLIKPGHFTNMYFTTKSGFKQ
jgi:hypothetical protein